MISFLVLVHMTYVSNTPFVCKRDPNDIFISSYLRGWNLIFFIVFSWYLLTRSMILWHENNYEFHIWPRIRTYEIGFGLLKYHFTSINPSYLGVYHSIMLKSLDVVQHPQVAQAKCSRHELGHSEHQPLEYNGEILLKYDITWYDAI